MSLFLCLVVWWLSSCSVVPEEARIYRDYLCGKALCVHGGAVFTGVMARRWSIISMSPMCDYMDTMWLLFVVMTSMSGILIYDMSFIVLLYRPFYGHVFIVLMHDTDHFRVRYNVFMYLILSVPVHDTGFLMLWLWLFPERLRALSNADIKPVSNRYKPCQKGI